MKHEKWHIVFAFVSGAALVVAPVIAVLALWSRGELTSGIYMWLVLVPVGIFAIVRGAMFTAENRRINMLEREGERVRGKYVSHGTKQGERAPMYYVRYSYESGGKTVMATSPSVYTWEQALAFRAAGEFTVLCKNGLSMIGEDAARLFEDNFDKVTQLKHAYNEAFNAVYRDLIEEAERKQREKNKKHYSDEEEGEEPAEESEEQTAAANEDETAGEAPQAQTAAESAGQAAQEEEEPGQAKAAEQEEESKKE